MDKIRFWLLFLCLVLLVGFVSALEDLDNDGIADNLDPETIVSSSATLLAGEYDFQNLSITNNAVLTLNSNTTLSGFKGVKIEALNLIVDAGAAISADEKGFPASQGPGVGQKSHFECNWYFGGSGYGGIGGVGYSAPGGPTYGSALNPVDLGSGGLEGQSGGGAILITVSDTVSLDGKISANGGNFSEWGGAGSGGSVNINTNRFTGSGVISANGGNGGYIPGCSRTSGSGGGGRIATYYQSSTFNGEIEANSPSFYKGGDGTIALIDKSNNIIYTGRSFTFQESESPFIFDHIILSNSEVIIGGNISITTDDFSMTNSQVTIDGLSSSINSENLISYNSTVLLKGGSRFSISQPALISDSNISLTGAQQFISIPSLTLNNSTITLAGAGTLRTSELILSNHSLVTTVHLSKIDLQLTNLNVDGSSVISADEKGFPASQGPGVGQKSHFECNWYFGGSGYGGIGGVGYSAPGGPTYGSALNPVDLGSGGLEGQSGGGAILITVSDTVSLDGKISANGGNFSEWGGAGSGGSVNINTNRFTGSGVISANGGNGGYIPGCSRTSGSGGGGRIATYYQSSTFNGEIEANSPSFYKGGDGTVEVSNPSIDAPISTLSFTEKTRNEKILTEDLLHKNATISNAICEGDLKGTLSISPFEMVKINSGSFIGKGFTKGNWQATLETLPYQGQWRGMFFLKESEKKIYLKGTTSGDISGVVEGYLTESTPGSGIYDHYNATWQINQIGNNQISATFTVSGLVLYQADTEYPSTQLYALQTSTQGVILGHYTEPLDIVLTNVRIADKKSHYDGEGFSILSYSSDSGSGEGWTYSKEIYQNVTELNGLFNKPLFGKVTGRLDETKTPRSLTLLLERLDIGQTPKPEIRVNVWGPNRVSPGQRFKYILEVSNDGFVTGNNVTVIKDVSPDVIFIDATGDFYFDNESLTTFWAINNISARSKVQLLETVETRWGLPQGRIVEDDVKWASADQFTNLYYGGISFKSTSKDFEKRYSDATKLYATLERSYLGTDIITGSVQTYLASKGIKTVENYLAVDEQGRTATIAFSHSGGTQTLYKKIESREIKVDYAVFAAPALLDQNKLGSLISSGKVKKILIIQSPQDILYNINIKFEREHEFIIHNPQGDIHYWAPAVTILDGPFIGGLLSNTPIDKIPFSIDIGDYLRDNNVDPNSLPVSEDFNIGGNGGIKQPFQSQDINGDGELDIVVQTINDPSETDPTKMHERLNSGSGGMIESYSQNLDDIPWLIKPNSINYQITEFNSMIWTGRDPNIKYGNEGRILQGQNLDYRVEYENEGDGNVYGAYIVDHLDPGLDDSSLLITPVYDSHTNSVIAPPGNFDPYTRTIIWSIGEVSGHSGGYTNISIKVKTELADNQKISNYATVFFPSVPEETNTNVVVSTTGLNHPPDTPLNNYPTNNEQISFNSTILNWSSNDPDKDTLRYDLYFGNALFPPLLASDYHDSKYMIQDLEKGATYYWKVIAKDPDGLSAESSIWKFSKALDISANFIATPITGTAPLSVQFNDTSTGGPTAWHWEFGDSGNSTVQNATHVYHSAGTFTVNLTVTNASVTDMESKTGYISVTSGVIPLPGFANPPTDPDSDGLYEDLNANNRKDFNDVVLMFNQMQWIAANEPVSAFDFNGNGRIDFNDIVKLFGEI